jgi:dihydroorotase
MSRETEQMGPPPSRGSRGRIDSLLLRNGRIVDPAGVFAGIQDIWIEDGILREVGSGLPVEAGREIDLGGAVVMPGLFDMHVHLREPGGEESETIRTGAAAAARGGFTGVACMPNTPVRIDTRAVIDLVLDRAREACGTRVHPVCGVTRGLEGEQITEMWELRAAGAVAASDDGFAVASSAVLRRGMEYATMCGLPVLSHCEDASLKGRGVMHEGYWSTVLGLRGIPAACEEIGVARDIALAELTGCALHVCHVSSRGSLDHIRRAKARGLRVTAETAPHYLALTDESLQTYDASFKMNPPLRTEADRAAVRQAVLDGTIDVIATDHAPHHPVAKDVELDQAPFGVIGLETSFGVSYRALVEEEGLPVEDLVRRMAVAPREILGLPGGRLERGRPADLTVVDLETSWEVDPSRFASLSRNCPFAGWTLPGRVLLTVAEGRITHSAPPAPRGPATREGPVGTHRGRAG